MPHFCLPTSQPGQLLHHLLVGNQEEPHLSLSLSLQFILGKGCSDPVIQDGWMVEVSIEKQTVTTGPVPGAERERHSPGSLALEGRSTLLPSVSILGKKGKYLGHPFSSKTNQFCVTSYFLKPSICTDFHLFFFQKVSFKACNQLLYFLS